MLNPYTSQEAVPENLREHYSKREDGKWHADIPNDHPAVTHNARLLSEKTTAITERDAARGELESAKASGLPRGHVAVARADAEMLDRLKAQGTPEELTAKLTEYPALKERVAREERKAKLDGLRNSFGWQESAIRVLEVLPDMPEVEERDATVDGKVVKMPHAKVKDGDAYTYQPFNEWFAAAHPEFLPSVVKPTEGTTTSGVKVFGSTATGGTPPRNLYDQIREDATRRDAAQKEQGIPLAERKGLTVIGGAV